MQFKIPKDTDRLKWTEHVKGKMLFYNLSETKIKNVLHRPDRTEEGIAPRTVAVMQRNKSEKNGPASARLRRGKEVWVMYQRKMSKLKCQMPKPKNIEDIIRNRERIIVISAWRYPGISPKGRPPIPQDVMEELNLIIKEDENI